MLENRNDTNPMHRVPEIRGDGTSRVQLDDHIWERKALEPASIDR